MNYVRAFDEVAKVAAELKAVREAGFTGEALKWRRDALAMELLCAFNGITPEQMPPGWRYFPNEQTRRAWNRVAGAAMVHYSKLWGAAKK